LLLPLLPRRAGLQPSREAAYRSAEGMSESQRAKQLILLPLSLLNFIFRVFRPKIACQAPKPLKPLKQNKIELAFSSPQSAILNI
jgi:hypothetical protein